MEYCYTLTMTQILNNLLTSISIHIFKNTYFLHLFSQQIAKKTHP